jgi:DNA-binding NtrC family response regulator
MAGEKILVVDDEKNMCQYLSIMLRKEGYDVKTVHNGKKALQEIKETSFDVVITDIRMEGMDGIELLATLKETNPALPVIIMTAYASQKTAIDALNRGAFYYLIKRQMNKEVKMVVRNALDMHKVRSENLFLKKQLKKKDDFKEIIGKSEEIQSVFNLVNKVADTDSTILVCGESGTGKELIAKAIHYRSSRANNPFVSINCGALPENLLESELFGHVKGSFTGAIRDKEGMFKVASSGTFFLDEVGETSLAIQVKLLRVLQEREIIPISRKRSRRSASGPTSTIVSMSFRFSYPRSATGATTLRSSSTIFSASLQNGAEGTGRYREKRWNSSRTTIGRATFASSRTSWSAPASSRTATRSRLKICPKRCATIPTSAGKSLCRRRK